MDRSLRLSGQDFSTGPKHQQADEVAKAPAGEGDFYDLIRDQRYRVTCADTASHLPSRRAQTSV